MAEALPEFDSLTEGLRRLVRPALSGADSIDAREELLLNEV